MFTLGFKAVVYLFDSLYKNVSNIFNYNNNIFNYNNNNNNNNNLCRCAICLGFISNENNVITKCNHNFCLSCLLEHLEINNKCPLCRETIIENKIKMKKLTHNIAVNFIKETIDEYNFDNLSQSIRCFDSETNNMLEAIVKFMMMDICNKLITEQNDNDNNDSGIDSGIDNDNDGYF